MNMIILNILSSILMITAQAQDPMVRMCTDWDKTFPQSEKVSHDKVKFQNRFGITLAADLYRPKDGGKAKLPAIAVSGPFGAVKEQASGKYAANKQLLIVPGATHCDLYDGGDGNYIPWGDIIRFLQINLL